MQRDHPVIEVEHGLAPADRIALLNAVGRREVAGNVQVHIHVDALFFQAGNHPIQAGQTLGIQRPSGVRPAHQDAIGKVKVNGVQADAVDAKLGQAAGNHWRQVRGSNRLGADQVLTPYAPTPAITAGQVAVDNFDKAGSARWFFEQVGNIRWPGLGVIPGKGKGGPGVGVRHGIMTVHVHRSSRLKIV